MDKKFFIELLEKYIKGDVTEEEERVLNSYYELFESNDNGLKSLNTEEREDLKNKLNKNIWEKIDIHEMKSREIMSKRKSWARWITAAAAVFIILSTGLYFYDYSVAKTQDLLSSSDKNIEHRLVLLPDGSTVIIGAGTRLNYPSTFDDSDKREVYLEGEAYFDIQRNPNKSFIIHTGKVQTVVLGTAFNIKAWPSESEITVTVVRGKVKVQDEKTILGIITPNHQISYNKVKENAIRSVVKADNYLAWKEQDLLLDNVTVAEALKLVEERFNVDISIKDESIQTSRFTTTFEKGASLEHVLKSVCEFNGADFQYDKDKASIIISAK